MKQNDNLIDVLQVLYKWRKFILGATIIATLGSVFICLALPNYYQATTIFYAASEDLAKPAPVGTVEANRDFYGKDTDLDRLFSIAQSNEVTNFLIDKHGLYQHYDIDPSKPKSKEKMNKRFKKLFKTQKTRYDALSLSMEDTDPTKAANIANDARDKINEIGQKVIKDSQKKLIDNFLNNISVKEAQISQINDSLANLKAYYDIFSTESQGEVIASQEASARAKLAEVKAKMDVFKNNPAFRDSMDLIKAKVQGYQNSLSSITSRAKKFNEGYAKVLSLETEQQQYSKQLGLDKERLKQLESSYATPFTSLHLVEHAEVPVMKSRPKRSILVLATMFLSFVLSILTVLLIHSGRSLNWEKIKS